ncbi:TetR/AcrR family transcriptional regulator [Trebonia sp.]|uniref:TetR/AcrR family transcriptional regulator n=1 Tax=Trebonia sp. TaxID=2767075 RepID=UPI00260233C5|nr:TetR/AcrR family transcriptional regulator [Trebonia sp.]
MGEPSRRRPAGAAVLQENVTSAITAAAFGELAEAGYARMSMEAVARRAGVGKAALYRRWDSKDAMLTDLVARAVREHALIHADTGTLRGDVDAYLRATFRELSNPLVSRIAPDFLAESPRNPPLAAALREVIATPRREVADAMLVRAIDRGELPADLDHDLALDLLAAPLGFRLLITQGVTDDDYLRRLTDVTVAALKACRS